MHSWMYIFFFQAEDGIRDYKVTGVQTCALPISFRTLPQRMIEDYVATGEALDKAGAYAVQGRGAALVERIRGDFFGVMGLPLRLALELLERFGGSEEHTSELQSPCNLVCRLLLEKK